MTRARHADTRSGFTLLELTIVIALSAVCSLILFDTLSAFYCLWDTTNTLQVREVRIFNSITLLRSEYSLAQQLEHCRENDIRFNARGPVRYQLLPQPDLPHLYALYRASGTGAVNKSSYRGTILADRLSPPPASRLTVDDSSGLLLVKLTASVNGVTINYQDTIYPRNNRRGPAL